MSSFTIRVYGICIENNRVLVSDEYIKGHNIAKFPGGGLEFGEGTIDCLKRELMEETGKAIEVLSHLYTTDFFQISAFNPAKQVMSIYYLFRFLSPTAFQVSETPFDFSRVTDQTQSLRWVDLKTMKQEDFTLPIDQKVAGLIKGTH